MQTNRKRTFWQIERFIVYRIFHANDTPHRLALSIGLGMFLAWTPTVGLQMLLLITLATAFRANRIVGLPIVWISNPLTVGPIYVFNWWFGQHVVALFSTRVTMGFNEIRARVGEIPFGHFYEGRFWKELWQLLLGISLDLWVGSLITGLVLGVLAYVTSYKLIVWYRTQTPRGRRHAARMLKETRKRRPDS